MSKKTICIVGIILAVFIAGIVYAQTQSNQSEELQLEEQQSEEFIPQTTVTTVTSVVDDVDDVDAIDGTNPLDGIHIQYQAILYSHTTIDITTTSPTIADFFSSATLTATLDDPAVQEDLTNLLDLFGITPIDGNGAYTRSNALQATYIYYGLYQTSDAIYTFANLSLTSAQDIAVSLPTNVSNYTNTLSYGQPIDFTAPMTRAQAYAVIVKAIITAPATTTTVPTTPTAQADTADTITISSTDQYNLSQALTLANENALLDLTDIDDLNGEITLLEVVTLIAQLDQYKQRQSTIAAENSINDISALAIQSSTTDDIVKISLTDLTATATAPTQNPEALEAVFESLSQYISQSTLDNLINTDTYTDSVDTLTLCNLLSAYLLPSTETTGDNNINNDISRNVDGSSGTTANTPDTTVVEIEASVAETPAATIPTVTETPATITPSTTTTDAQALFDEMFGNSTAQTATKEESQAGIDTKADTNINWDFS